jgi:hypothetical protein
MYLIGLIFLEINLLSDFENHSRYNLKKVKKIVDIKKLHAL